MDEQIVQQEPVPIVEPVSPTAETEQKVEVKPAETPALTAEQVRQMIAEAVGTAKESGKRELQSQQDRNKMELARTERRARIAETRLGAARTQVRGLDPDLADKMELAELRAGQQGQTTLEQEEQMAQYQTEVVQKFHAQMNQFVTGLGVDPKDPKIDWAEDATDLLQKQQRILDSVTGIQKGNIQAMQTVQKSLEERLKALEVKAKAEMTEANSVETSTSIGVVAGSDREFVKNFAEDKIPLTKANVERYQKLVEQS